jgi:8-oxo-dGTP diphosphatase
MTDYWTFVVQGLIIHPETKLVLMAHRPPGKKKPLMWEYPGGKVERDETLPEALNRELREELDIDAIIGPRINRSVFSWKENIELNLYVVEKWTGGDPKPLVATELRWVDPYDAIDNLPMLPGAFAAYREVMAYLGRSFS